MVSALYAVLGALLLIKFSFDVVRLRMQYRVSYGDGGFSELQSAIRIHGNAVEYIPVALILLLFALILHNNKMRMPDGEIMRKGLLMGMFTSPWIANIVLSPLDHLLKEQCGVDNYVRYMDDGLIIHSNKRKLQKALSVARDWLDKHGLSFKRPPAIHRTRLVKINYIGYTLAPGKTVLCDATYLKIRRAINRISKKPAINIYDARRVVSYAGQFKAVDTRTAFRKHIAAKVNVKTCRRIISRGKRRHNKCFGKNANLTPDQKKLQSLKTDV